MPNPLGNLVRYDTSPIHYSFVFFKRSQSKKVVRWRQLFVIFTSIAIWVLVFFWGNFNFACGLVDNFRKQKVTWIPGIIVAGLGED